MSKPWFGMGSNYCKRKTSNRASLDGGNLEEMPLDHRRLGVKVVKTSDTKITIDHKLEYPKAVILHGLNLPKMRNIQSILAFMVAIWKKCHRPCTVCIRSVWRLLKLQIQRSTLTTNWNTAKLWFVIGSTSSSSVMHWWCMWKWMKTNGDALEINLIQFHQSSLPSEVPQHCHCTPGEASYSIGHVIRIIPSCVWSQTINTSLQANLKKNGLWFLSFIMLTISFCT